MHITDSTTLTNNLKKALSLTAEIAKKQAEIEDLEEKRNGLLASVTSSHQPRKSPSIEAPRGPKSGTKKPKAPAPKKRAEKEIVSKLAGKPRPVSPSGPLAPAVVKAIDRTGRPLKVSEILAELAADNYVWTAKNPKQTLYVRIAKLHGVKKLEDGYFTTTSVGEASKTEQTSPAEAPAPQPESAPVQAEPVQAEPVLAAV